MSIPRCVWSWANQEKPLDRTILLKAPKPGGERGVLLIFPENNWLRLILRPSAAQYVGEKYTLILTAGWSPLDYSLLEAVLRHSPERSLSNHATVLKNKRSAHSLPDWSVCQRWVVIGSIPTFTSRYRATSARLISSWSPIGRRSSGIGTSSVRMRQLPATLRVQLIGQPDGNFTVERIKQQAADFAVPQQLEFLDQLSVDQVQDHLGQARISVILSRHEGYCGAVTESLFADTPVGLLHDAYIGSKDYINPKTGMFLPHRGLGRALATFLAQAGDYCPRDWALENISFRCSTPKVNTRLKERAALDQLPWTEDLAPFCWRPYPTLLQANARLAGAADDLIQRFPDTFGSGLITAIKSIQ